MSTGKKHACVSVSTDAYHKLNVIYTVRKVFFDERGVTMSGIVSEALEEYFANHDKEIRELMDKYHEKGGCFDL